MFGFLIPSISRKMKLLFTLLLVLGAYGVWASLNPFQQRIVVAVVVLGGLLAATNIMRTVGETSGREEYTASPLGSAWAWLSSRVRNDPDVIPVDHIEKKEPGVSHAPKIDVDTSVIALGQTGRGKSTFIKSVIDRWDHEDHGVIAHALSEGTGNEFEDFFAAARIDPSHDIYILSSQNSTHRWNPFEDFEGSMQDMKNISDGIWESRNSVETGWSDSARALLTAALAVTSARHGDFAYLPEVLEDDPQQIVEDCEQLPQGTLVTSPLASMSSGDLSSAYSKLMSEIQPLLLSEIFDESLPTLSLTQYFDGPQGYVVLDNRRADTYARPFWRFLIQTAIDLSMEHSWRQDFVLDEFDKLPPIANLDELASAGRSGDSVGILAAQDIHQIEAKYPNLGRSIYSNSPNRAIFAAGDEDTAEVALSALGRDEVTETTVSQSAKDRINPDQGLSRRKAEKYPLTQSKLMNLEVGECLLHTQHGWWLAKITEPEL